MTPDLAIVQLFIPSQCCIAALSQVSRDTEGRRMLLIIKELQIQINKFIPVFSNLFSKLCVSVPQWQSPFFYLNIFTLRK
jgi:hypothetical protein